MTPILYSFRRCPYAIRARMAIAYAGVQVELREILLRDKPAEMLEASVKGTVPVLVLPSSTEDDTTGTTATVIDESEDVMRWALSKSDPDDWLALKHDTATRALIEQNDHSFKTHLDRYKYSDRHPDEPAEVHRTRAEVFLSTLEKLLESHAFLFSDQMTFADVAIFPFIRQFAFVDKVWFDAAPYPKLQAWLDRFLASDRFELVMTKYPVWRSGERGVQFPRA